MSRYAGLQSLRETLIVSEATSRSMRANSRIDTGPEVKLRKALWAAGVRGYRKNDRRIFGRPDLWFARARLCVFVHGCFWHGCKRCTKNLKPKQNAAFWEAKVSRNRKRDALVLESLTANNCHVEVFWECEVRQNLAGVVAKVRECLDVLEKRGASER